ncbi:hypothetical protein CMV_026933 [Castanea mollissima]|uniref:Uncharacterized protein n=1 Tax=Castanea mollissima TaxID=60419 RepID=A0A8J4V721_9ROSI|nr:hypothetical protein CMV_026933 [Castanea mollissima]
MSFQCPSKLVPVLEKDSPSQEAIMGSKQHDIQEEICEPLNANLKDNVEDPDLADVDMLNIDDLDLKDEGWPWIWDRDALHAGHANTYSFVEGNKKDTHMCKRHAKLEVKEEFLIRKIVPFDGILGPAPNSTELSYFQRGRVDGGILTWLKK